MSRLDDNERWLREEGKAYPFRTSVPSHKSPAPDWWDASTGMNFVACPGRAGVIWCFTNEIDRDVFQAVMMEGA